MHGWIFTYESPHKGQLEFSNTTVKKADPVEFKALTKI